MRWCFFSPGPRSIQVLDGDTWASGGAEAQIAYIAAALARAGHSVSLIHGNGRGVAVPVIRSGVVCLEAAPSWRQPRSLNRFWLAMQSLSPDILYARLPSDFLWLMGLFAKLDPDRRFIYALAHDDHCNPRTSYDHKRWLHVPLYAAGLRTADVIAVQHDGQVDLLPQHLRASRIVPLPNLVRHFNTSPRSFLRTTYDAAWIAMVRPEKQLELFLDLARRLPDHRFAVAGSYDTALSDRCRAELETTIAGLPNVDYKGPLRSDGVLALLNASRMVVNTSSGEGFPNTMLEAWSVGIPVVSLSVDPGGVIEREGLGRIGGTVDGLVGHVHELARDASLNLTIGARALAFVRSRHNFDAVCAALEKLTPDVVSSHASGPISDNSGYGS